MMVTPGAVRGHVRRLPVRIRLRARGKARREAALPRRLRRNRASGDGVATQRAALGGVSVFEFCSPREVMALFVALLVVILPCVSLCRRCARRTE